jgi:ATP-dependent RNA helicase DDX47/RRP3
MSSVAHRLFPCRLSIILRILGFAAVPIHGDMSQSQRLGALSKFKSGSRKVLVATDVASRSVVTDLLLIFTHTLLSGLDIPSVDVVINFDVPQHSKDYIHRVGRTARAGRSGKSITLVTQYDVELLQRIEEVTGKKMTLYETEAEDIAALKERVEEAGRVARAEMKNADGKGRGTKRYRHDNAGGKDDRDRDDDVVEAGMPVKKFKHRR